MGGSKTNFAFGLGEIRCSSLPVQAGKRASLFVLEIVVDVGVGKSGAWPSREGVGMGRVLVGGRVYGMGGVQTTFHRTPDQLLANRVVPVQQVDDLDEVHGRGQVHPVFGGVLPTSRQGVVVRVIARARARACVCALA